MNDLFEFDHPFDSLDLSTIESFVSEWSELEANDDCETFSSLEIPSKGQTGQATVVNYKEPKKKKVVKSRAKTILTAENGVSFAFSKSRLGVECIETKLYAFPSFDKSDAMIYLPSTIARLSNSGDYDGLFKTITKHCSKDCPIQLHPSFSIPLPNFKGLMEMSDIVVSDAIKCMYSTKVVNNQIIAVMYGKYSNSPEMHTYAQTMPAIHADPLYRMAFIGNRKELIARNIHLYTQSEGIRKQVEAILDLNEDLEVYTKSELILTFDPHTKKIIHYQNYSSVTSVNHNGVQYNFEPSAVTSL